jgi:hypothetical protein
MTQPLLPAVATPLVQLYRHVWQHADGVRARMATALAMLGGSQVLKLAMPWMAAQAINSIQTAGIAGLAIAGRWIAGILGLQMLVWAFHGPARVMERSVALRVRRSVADACIHDSRTRRSLGMSATTRATSNTASTRRAVRCRASPRASSSTCRTSSTWRAR